MMFYDTIKSTTMYWFDKRTNNVIVVSKDNDNNIINSLLSHLCFAYEMKDKLEILINFK